MQDGTGRTRSMHSTAIDDIDGDDDDAACGSSVCCGDESQGCARFIAKAIVRNHGFVIICWIVIFIISATTAPWLLGACKSVYDPLPWMPSGKSKAAFDKHYHEIMGKTVDSVLFTLKRSMPKHLGESRLKAAANALDHVLKAIKLRHPGLIEEVRSWRQGQGAGEFGRSYISKDNRTFLLEVHWKSLEPGHIREETTAVSQLLASVNNLNKTYAPMGVDMVATGEHAVATAVQEEAQRDVGLHAVMFLPVAIGATHTQLCRWQLLLLPAICCMVSLAGAFSLGYWAAKIVTVGTSVPTIMAFLCIALVIDWSFFLLARFREETLKRRPGGHEEAIIVALVNTGSNIALSGFMIFLCSSCMVLMPQAIASNALGGCLVVVSGVSVCLTLLPALLAAAPPCFAGSHSDCDDCFDEGGQTEDGMPKTIEGVRKSPWYRWAMRVTTYPCNLILLVLLCVVFAPCTVALFLYDPAVDDKMGTPPRAPAVIARKRLNELFAGKDQGKSNMLILAEGNRNCSEGVKNNGYFSTLCNLSRALSTLRHGGTPLKPEYFLGIGFYAFPAAARITCLPWKRKATKSFGEWWYNIRHNASIDGQTLLTGDINVRTADFDDYHHLYDQLWSRVVSKDGSSSVMLLRLPWSAMNSVGFQLVRDLRKALDTFRSSSSDSCMQITGHELSLPSVWVDYVDASVSTLPKAMLLACAITTPFIGITYQSCMAPLKLLLTVILPLTWIYGTAILVYQYGLLDFLGAAQVHSHSGMHWSVPCMTAILLLALALDYNIFYFGRVHELRMGNERLDDEESIRRGLVATGPIITTAGVIFAVEFTGMFFSATELNRQGGFVIVTGVLFDTFVIRSVMMPATLSLGAQYNWWPSKAPEIRGPHLSSRTSTLQTDAADSDGDVE